jgi:hypothetical protein
MIQILKAIDRPYHEDVRNGIWNLYPDNVRAYGHRQAVKWLLQVRSCELLATDRVTSDVTDDETDESNDQEL